MKSILSVTATLFCVFFLLSSFSIREFPQDPPRGEKKQRHIKLEKIDGGVKKMELDTIVNDGDIFVWNGDTIDYNRDMEWMSDEDSGFDMALDVKVNEDLMNRVFVYNGGSEGAKSWVYDLRSGDGDDSTATSYKVEVITNGDKNNQMAWCGKGRPFQAVMPPLPPKAPLAPDIFFTDKHRAENIIDLSDSDIISFKKKDISGGREKITIVRDKSKDKSKNVTVFAPQVPGKMHTMTINMTNDAPFQIDGNDSIRVTKKDGEVIRITENKKEVEVDEKIENENN